jgi:hypothetical protein
MKTFFLASFFLLSSLGAFGQASDTEKDFESRKKTFTTERFAEGEDATSGFDYLFYKSGGQIVKIRSIWSASHSKELRVEDSYFNGDQLLLFRRFTAPSRSLNSLKKGGAGSLAPGEEFHFTGGKLGRWVVGGKPRLPGDAGWAKMEKEILEQAQSLREYYTWLKEGK